METRTCLYCGEEITGKRSDALYCSNTCKAKHWEQQQENDTGARAQGKTKDVTHQLRGVLNGELNPDGTLVPRQQKTQLVRKFVSARNDLLAPFESELRRLADVRKQLENRVKKQTEEIRSIAGENGIGWLLILTGAGALIGHQSSEEKVRGTVIGSTLGRAAS